MKSIFATCILFYGLQASAAYIPTGSFSGEQNNTFSVKLIKNIVAMRDKDGNLFNLPTRYESVDGFRGGVCRVTVKNDDSGGNIMGILSNKFFQKTFYLIKKDGKFVDVDINELFFNCSEEKK